MNIIKQSDPCMNLEWLGNGRIEFVHFHKTEFAVKYNISLH
jgi:hypothetical protein